MFPHHAFNAQMCVCVCTMMLLLLLVRELPLFSSFTITEKSCRRLYASSALPLANCLNLDRLHCVVCGCRLLPVPVHAWGLIFPIFEQIRLYAR